MNLSLSCAALNLRFNPFGELPLDQRGAAALPRCDMAAIMKSLRDPARVAIQFVGPCGSGKSTHLHMLSDAEPRFRYTWMPRWRISRMAGADYLMVDEAQRLAWPQRRRLFRQASRVVLGTHRDLGRRLQRSGFQVTTITLKGPPSTTQLAAILNRKIEWARRGPGPVPQVSIQQSQQLLNKFGNNLRAMHGWMYEEFQRSASGPPAKTGLFPAGNDWQAAQSPVS